MKIMKAILILPFFLTGCASSGGTFFNRPVVENSVKKTVSTVSLSADRRTVVIVTEGDNRGNFCAEPPPDAATGLKASLDAAIEGQGKAASKQFDAQGKASISDKFETNITVLAERTAQLDAFRTGVYALCQLNLNGAIPDDQVGPTFNRLIEMFAHTSRTSLDVKEKERNSVTLQEN